MQKRTMLIGAALTGALLVSGGAGAVAGGLVTSAQIKNGTIRTVDVKNNTLRKADLTPKVRTALAKRALDGVNGLDGLPGIDGTNGADGTNGTNGTDGTDGIDGLSAYDLAVEAGFEGSLEEWLDSLRGVNGKDGAPGQDGKDGEQGPEGPRGPEGAPGLDGKDAAVESMTICLVRNGSSQQVKLATNGACVGTESITIYTPAA